MKPKVIITAYAHPWLTEQLGIAGFEVHENFTITYSGLKDIISRYEGLVLTTRLKIDKDMLDRASSLKWIGRLGSGMEVIDVDYAKSKNIICESSPEGNRDAVAEQCVGMLLSLMHKIASSSEEVRKGIWSRDSNRGTELRGKKVGIIGFGNTGGRFADLLSSFGVEVLAYDKYRKGYGGGHIIETDLANIMEAADVVSLHLPLNNETHHLANDVFFKGFNKAPYFLNTSRGKIVDTEALIKALDEGLVRGAALDVLENEDFTSYTTAEKIQLSSLFKRNNVIVTPHIAGYSDEALFKMASVLLKKLRIISET
jgi:D-3-phosphoglycerate dehydrogenase